MTKHLWLVFLLLPVFGIGQVSNSFLSPQTHAWQIVGQDTFSAGLVKYINLVFSQSGEPYVAYIDQGMNSKFNVMKYDGTHWVTVGTYDSIPTHIEELSFVLSPSGEPYVAFVDFGGLHGVHVMKFDGSNWLYVGNPNLSGEDAQSISLAFSPTDADPYVAYSDFSDSLRITVRKFDGNNWINVGAPGFTTVYANYVSLAISASGQPYVAYQRGELTFDYKASVMKFDGNNWVHVGNEFITNTEADETALHFSPSGEPYLAYSDYLHFKGATVMKYNGTDWVNVGATLNQYSGARHIQFAFSPVDHQPSVVFEDEMNWSKATVMHFNGSQWVSTGSPGFSPGLALFTSIAFNLSGIPYVAYSNGADAFNYKVTVEKFDSVYMGLNEVSKSEFLIFPDPASTEITLQLAANSGQYQVSCINVSGQICLTQRIFEPKTTIDIRNLSRGMYYIKLVNDKGVSVGKFIKQ